MHFHSRRAPPCFAGTHATARQRVRRHIMVDLKFRYPMTVAGMGMLTSGVLSFLCCRVFRLVDAKTPVTFEFWVKKCLPVGFFMVRYTHTHTHTQTQTQAGRNPRPLHSCVWCHGAWCVVAGRPYSTMRRHETCRLRACMHACVCACVCVCVCVCRQRLSGRVTRYTCTLVLPSFRCSRPLRLSSQ